MYETVDKMCKPGKVACTGNLSPVEAKTELRFTYQPV